VCYEKACEEQTRGRVRYPVTCRQKHGYGRIIRCGDPGHGGRGAAPAATSPAQGKRHRRAHHAARGIPDQPAQAETHRRMFRLAENCGGAPASYGTVESAKWTGSLPSLARPTTWCACATWRPQFPRCKPGPRCVWWGIESGREARKIRNQLARTPLAMKNGKQNAVSVNFSATC